MTSIAATLLPALRAIVGDSAVSDDAADLDFYARDALGATRGAHGDPARPLAVVHPSTAEQVADVVALAARERVPVVPYGGGSGLMGGARSVRPGIVLAMDRMARVREVDARSGWCWAEAGCVLADVSAALEPHGLMLAHDPWTAGIATVGGALSTNGLGFLGGKYGSMGEQALAVEAVLPDGTLVRTRPQQPHSAGFDLRALFAGGEGVFGVVTAACLRAFPIPEARELRGWRFVTFEAGYDAIMAMHAIGLTPAVLDYGERFAPPADSLMAQRWGRETEPPALYLGFDGLREEVAALLARATAICAGGGGTPLDDADVREFWDSRHVPAEGFARRRAASRGATAAQSAGDSRSTTRTSPCRRRACSSIASARSRPPARGTRTSSSAGSG